MSYRQSCFYFSYKIIDIFLKEVKELHFRILPSNSKQTVAYYYYYYSSKNSEGDPLGSESHKPQSPTSGTRPQGK